MRIESQKEKKNNISNQTTLKLKVVGQQTIHCDGCERTVEFTLSRLPGVSVVKADHNTQLIEIALTGEGTDLEMVQSELEWIGYRAEAA